MRFRYSSARTQQQFYKGWMRQEVQSLLVCPCCGTIHGCQHADRATRTLKEGGRQRHVCSSNMFRPCFCVSSDFVLCLLQVLMYHLFYERCVEDKVRQFVDLCSISNVGFQSLINLFEPVCIYSNSGVVCNSYCLFVGFPPSGVCACSHASLLWILHTWSVSPWICRCQHRDFKK